MRVLARARLRVRERDRRWRIDGEEVKEAAEAEEEVRKKVGSVSRARDAPSSSARKVPGSRLLHARVLRRRTDK